MAAWHFKLSIRPRSAPTKAELDRFFMHLIELLKLKDISTGDWVEFSAEDGSTFTLIEDEIYIEFNVISFDILIVSIILDFANRYDLIILDEEDQELPPELPAFIESASTSSAFRFSVRSADELRRHIYSR